MMKRKKRSYKFTEKKHSKKGIISLALGLCSVGAAVSVVVVSFKYAGNASVYVGSAGVFSLLLSLAALILGIQSLKEEESYKLFPGLGTILSGLAFLGWAAVYAAGFYL